MNGGTDWMTALVILGAGLAVGVLFLFVTRSRGSRKIGNTGHRRDLESRRDALLAKLRKGNLEGNERQQVELETAAVLRAIDDLPPVAAAAAPSPDVVAPQSPFAAAARGFAWGVATFAAIGGLAWFVMKQAEPRDGMGAMPAEEQSSVRVQPMQPANVEELRAKVTAEPENIAYRLELGRALLQQDDLMGVYEQADAVLKKDPENSQALVFQGVVRAAMGEGPMAIELLERAARNDPKNLDAWVARAWVHAQRGNAAAAEQTIAEAKNVVPGEAALLDEVLRQIRTHIASASGPAGASNATSATEAQLPAGHPSVEMPPPAGQ